VHNASNRDTTHASQHNTSRSLQLMNWCRNWCRKCKQTTSKQQAWPLTATVILCVRWIISSTSGLLIAAVRASRWFSAICSKWVGDAALISWFLKPIVIKSYSCQPTQAKNNKCYCTTCECATSQRDLDCTRQLTGESGSKRQHTVCPTKTGASAAAKQQSPAVSR
jgi:hypothetical protein